MSVILSAYGQAYLKADVVHKRLEHGRADSVSRFLANAWYLSPSERTEKKHGRIRSVMKLIIIRHSSPSTRMQKQYI